MDKDDIAFITRPQRHELQGISDYFTAHAQSLPDHRRDMLLNGMINTLTGQNLPEFIMEEDNYFCIAQHGNGDILGAICAIYQDKDTHAQAGWLDPADHMRIMFIHIQNGAHLPALDHVGVTLADVMMTAVFKKCAQLGGERIEAFIHVDDRQTIDILAQHDFIDAGLVADNVRNTPLLQTQIATNYRRHQFYMQTATGLRH